MISSAYWCATAGHQGLFRGTSGVQVTCLGGTESQDKPAPADSFSSAAMREWKGCLWWTPDVRGVDMFVRSPCPRDVGSFASSLARILFSAGLGFQMNFTNDCFSACCGYLQKGTPVCLDLPV